MVDLYRVTVGEDVYIGTPDEVLAFMMRAEGAPGDDPHSFMVAVAARVGERLDVSGIAVDSAESFLESLREKGVLPIEVTGEPSSERVDREEALGDGPIAFGPDVDPDDIDF